MPDYLDGFTQLHRVDPDERAAVWRQSMATLAAAVADHRRYVPLEGLDPSELAASVRVAIEDGLVDELGFLSEQARGAALYELASALPSGVDKRQLGRRVLAGLRGASGRACVGVATQIALGAPRALSGAANRARVALVLDRPTSMPQADAMALALISRGGAGIDWLQTPSMGSLPSRRLAARLLERAAREAARRAAGGDDSGVRVFDAPEMRAAWDRLLADRESLVWRHVAAARGLLSRSRPTLAEEIERHLDEGLGITEWRRAATSLVASIAVQPDAMVRARALLASPVAERDPGMAALMVTAIPLAAESEPDAADELLDVLIKAGGLAAAEALVEIRRGRAGFGEWAARSAAARLDDRLGNALIFDDGERALLRCVIDDLRGGDDEGLEARVEQGIVAFREHGPGAAAPLAAAALEAATELIASLEEYTVQDEEAGRIWAFRTLRTIDRSLLASDGLANLLNLTASGADADEALRSLGDLFQRLTNWLVIHEGDAELEESAPHFTHRIRRLRSFLHLVDADGRRVDDRSELLRQRRTLTARVLLARVQHDRATTLRRALCAAAARACDALVREESCEVSDVLLVAGRVGRETSDILAMAEASMVPDLEVSLRAYARLRRVLAAMANADAERAARTCVEEIVRFAHDLPIATSPRVEALRHALLDLAYALEPLALSGSLREFAERTAGETPLAGVGAALQNLAQLTAGASRRLESAVVRRPESGAAVRFIDIHLERCFRGGETDLPGALRSALATFEGELPKAIAGAAARVLELLSSLPMDSDVLGRASLLTTTPKEVSLPAWVPPSRVIGGFYLARPIGMGAVGSVFVARRSDARHDPSAEQFALKVPDYSGAAARTLSEEEFLDLFRQEAGALLSLPAHPNLAGFVTFDARARPKPLLVMELVEGPNLERLIEARNLDMGRAFDLLEGVAQGLAAMHAAGVAHLDLKPSNVIVRDPDGLAGPDEPTDPVLVDFGLAGRQLRPGCGTANYGAPEVWGQDASGEGRATPADVYAFGCLAHELLTGQTLFQETNDLATIAAHLQHDGMPAPVGRLTEDPRTAAAGDLIRCAIRRNGAERITMNDVCANLQRIRPSMEGLEWPIRLGG
ncbi:MAG: serine/threonine-protein kinase [Myxococcota bacterium]